jgi:hypothetical protein
VRPCNGLCLHAHNACVYAQCMQLKLHVCAITHTDIHTVLCARAGCAGPVFTTQEDRRGKKEAIARGQAQAPRSAVNDAFPSRASTHASRIHALCKTLRLNEEPSDTLNITDTISQSQFFSGSEWLILPKISFQMQRIKTEATALVSPWPINAPFMINAPS